MQPCASRIIDESPLLTVVLDDKGLSDVEGTLTKLSGNFESDSRPSSRDKCDLCDKKTVNILFVLAEFCHAHPLMGSLLANKHF